MPFFAPLDLQQLLGIMWTMNIILPWDHTTLGETFQIEDINLEELEANSSF